MTSNLNLHFCKYCRAPLSNPNQNYCNPEHYEKFKTEGPLIPSDPVINFLARLNFETNIFNELGDAHHDPDKWEQYFKTPDVFIFYTARFVFGTYDPNTDDPKTHVDHMAMYNLLGWFTIKCITDPVWFSYLGWLNRFIGAHTNTSSYFPLKFHERFIPNKFFTRNEEVIVPEENTKFNDPSEVFKWRGPQSEEQ